MTHDQRIKWLYYREMWRSRFVRFGRIVGKLQRMRYDTPQDEWLVRCTRLWNWVDHQEDGHLYFEAMQVSLPSFFYNRYVANSAKLRYREGRAS